jgi:4-amino-4-deoxy-L-arabinose transferase-like glycosyltransferase
LFFRLGSLPLSGADEPRYARIAQEMHDRGQWITPTLQGKPWLEKPPLYYWITIPAFSLFDSHETAARIGPAACALISGLTIFWLGSLLWTRQAGLMGALILLTSLGFAGYGRSASTDMPFACCLTVAMAILAAASERAIGRGKVRWAFVLLGLAALGKGPVAFILTAGIMLGFWLLDERRIVLSRWRVLTGLIIALAISVPWFWLAFRQNGYAFISTFFINHNIARYVTSIHHHSQPFYYYFVALLALIFPWSGWLLALVSKSPIKGFRRWRQWDSRMLFLSCWTLFPLLFFSFSDSKLAGYILPSLPPLTLILGVRLSRWIDGNSESISLRAGTGLNLVFSAAFAIAAPIYFQKNYGGNWETGLVLSAAILAPSLFAFGFGIRGHCHRAFKATVVHGLLIIFAITQFAFPVLADYHSARDIARQALQQQQPGEPVITYGFFHHSLNYYSGYRVADKLDDPQAVRDFGKKYPHFLVVTNARRMPEILNLNGFTASILGKQGNTHLFRLSRN